MGLHSTSTCMRYTRHESDIEESHTRRSVRQSSRTDMHSQSRSVMASKPVETLRCKTFRRVSVTRPKQLMAHGSIACIGAPCVSMSQRPMKPSSAESSRESTCTNMHSPLLELVDGVGASLHAMRVDRVCSLPYHARAKSRLHFRIGRCSCSCCAKRAVCHAVSSD
eukprot:6199770-Pleurochrysis_carterae.AAC.5